MERTQRSAGISEAILLETLISRGWRFRDFDEIRALIRSKDSSDGNSGTTGTLESIESELLNMDLRSFGGPSLPEPSVVKKLPHLQGPIILQVASVRDVCQSRIDASFRNSNPNHRLLRFTLTDGRSDVVAVEYGPIPSIAEEIIPGTKVRLENKIAICNGLLCLTSKVVSILGGLVQSLYEEWQMSQKYSGFSRSTFKQSHSIEGVGPPPFEKLHLEACSYQVPHQHSSHSSPSYPPKSSMELSLPSNCDEEQGVKNQGHQTEFSDSKADKMDDDSNMASTASRIEDKPGSSEARPKEVIEAVPMHNQAAAQKLLQKMSQPSHESRHLRGPRYKGKNTQVEGAVFTLDEWERRKASSANPVKTGRVLDVSNDEEFARQLQNQLDLEEDSHVKSGHGTEAEQIRLSMFGFGREEGRNDGRRAFRGRGRGRGRGRNRFG